MSRPFSSAAAVEPVAEIRNHFPALDRKHNGHPVAYFDGPGGTQVPRRVVEAMSDYLINHNANTHWAYPSSAETDAALSEARAVFADFFGAAPDEVAFGANMTTLTFHLARALGRGRFAPGDEIIVTELDHHANVDPWRTLCEERGLKLRTVRAETATGQLDWDDFERQVSERTKLIAVGAASNALGTISDVRRAADLARRVGALCFVDAVHYAPHELVDVRTLGCDLLACSAYKFYGPHVGVLYGRRELLQTVDFPKLRPAPDGAPERAETGTLNHEGIVGAAAAVEFLASLADEEVDDSSPAGGDRSGKRRARLRTVFGELHARGAQLLRLMWEGLSSVPEVTIYGPPPDQARTPTIAFTVSGHSSENVARRLAGRGVFVSHGDFYASTIVEQMNLSAEGLVRAGCAVYTAPEEVERLVEGVRTIAADAR